jgi:hypothetical protein
MSLLVGAGKFTGAVNKGEVVKIDEAARLLDLKTDELRAFDEIDPFNGVQVKGYISRRQDKRYGAVVIYYADGNTEPQVIYGTPKFHYPFDKNGLFKFPTTDRIEVHEKIDGTNILGYTYWSRPKGKIHPLVTYKTRLMPFVGDRGAGNFLTMWRRVLEKYPQTPFLVHAAGDGYDGAVGFEMFGSLNKHLMLYDVPLDARLLFKVDSAGVYPPGALEWTGTLPAVTRVATLLRPVDLHSWYRKYQAELGAALELTDDGYKGAEGYMWYVLRSDDRQWEVFKCKPEEIEAIHFASGGMGRNAVIHAAWRVIEDYGIPEGEDLLALTVVMLSEDWNPDEIKLAMPTVRSVVSQVQAAAEFKATCLTAAKELWDTGLSLKEDKGAFMRALAAKLSPAEMRKAYSLLAAEESK